MDASPSQCPACFFDLPPLAVGEVRSRCPRCTHLIAPDDTLQQTDAHTPLAKHASKRPPDGK